MPLSVPLLLPPGAPLPPAASSTLCPGPISHRPASTAYRHPKKYNPQECPSTSGQHPIPLCSLGQRALNELSAITFPASSHPFLTPPQALHPSSGHTPGHGQGHLPSSHHLETQQLLLRPLDVSELSVRRLSLHREHHRCVLSSSACWMSAGPFSVCPLGSLRPGASSLSDGFCLVCFLKATPGAYEGSQARGPIGAAAAGLHYSHSHARSKMHSSRQHWILNPRSEARDQTRVLTDTSWALNLLSHSGNSCFIFLNPPPPTDDFCICISREAPSPEVQKHTRIPHPVSRGCFGGRILACPQVSSLRHVTATLKTTKQSLLSAPTSSSRTFC